MGTTTRGYVYPASTADTQLWTHFQTLADDIDADVQAVEDAQATNVAIDQLNADSATWGATESGSLLSVSPSVVNGQVYWVTVSGQVSADVAADSFLIRVRLTSAVGTQLIGRQGAATTTSVVGYNITACAKFTASSTGVQAVHVTGQRNGGTGTAHRIRASGTNPFYIRVDRVPT